MAKLDIDFVLLDESVVMYGFRALMNGAKLEAFKKNPVMLFMHLRAETNYNKQTDDRALPIGKWDEVRVVGDKLLGKPVFDDDDDFAQKVQKKVEKGYLNAASIWIDPIAVSDDETLKLAGQRGPTVTKWGLFEASIVDIPNCQNALAIRNSAGKKVALSGDAESGEVIDFLNTLIPQSENMDKKLLAAKLGLTETAADAEIATKLTAVLGDAAQVVGLNAEITKLKGDNGTLTEKLAGLEKAAGEKKVTDLVDGAIAAKKLTASDRDRYIKLATADYDTTKEVIDTMKAFEGVENKLTIGADASSADQVELAELVKLSGRDLYLNGKLQRLQKLSVAHYNAKYKEYFGHEPK